MIGQLVSILLDNAVKYTDEGGEIRVMLEKQGRAVHLSVFNTVEAITPQELEHPVSYTHLDVYKRQQEGKAKTEQKKPT